MSKSVAVVLLGIIGAIAGYVYFQDGTNMGKLRIFSITQSKEVPRSMKTAPTNDTASVQLPEPESLRKTAPIKNEPLDAVPLPRFTGEPHTPSALEKTGVPVVLAPGSGTGETVKAATPTESKTSGAVSPDRSKKNLAAASVPDKTSAKISTSASKPAKFPTPPKISETARQNYGKPVPKPVQTQKEPSDKDLTAGKKLSVTESSSAGFSVFSKKSTPGTTALSSEKPPAQTAAVKEEPPVVPQMVTQEKEGSAGTLPGKKSAQVQSDSKAVSLKRQGAEPETVAKRTVSQYNLQNRLKIFLNAYCRTYERKNLDMFGGFFAPDAVEQGRPFKSWAPQYRQNFNRIDSMVYNIKLDRYSTHDETEEVRIEGTFQVRAKLSGSEKWRKSSGRITMVLESYKDSFRVKELNY
jgi:hypothetical protein